MATHFRFSTLTTFDPSTLSDAQRRTRYDPIILRHFRSWGRAEDDIRGRLDGFWEAQANEADKGGRDEGGDIIPSDERHFVSRLLHSFLTHCSWSDRTAPGLENDLERAGRIIEGFDIYQAKCAYLLICDYPKDWIATLLKVGSVQVFSTHEGLASQQEAPLLFGLGHRAMLERQKKPPDVSPGLLTALIDGRLGWEEKERVEAACLSHLHLLQDLVILEEVGFLLRSVS